MDSSINIKGKIILITGALGQIGIEISKSFLLQGAKVILTDINLKAELELTKEFKNLGIDMDQFEFFELDITKEDQCKEVVDNIILRFSRIDVLINNAAIDAKFDKHSKISMENNRFEFFPISELKKSVEVNLIGTIIITQLVIQKMVQEGKGNIINVASTYSLVAPNQRLYDFGVGKTAFKPVDYVVSKSFLPNFTRYIATFYAKQSIRCNTIVPHGVFNDHSKDFLKNWEELSPIGRMCNSYELNGPFIFLASDASSYMTGSTLVVDGGWTAW